MLLHYFYNTRLAHASYLVGCQATGEALIVDPGRDVDLYLRTVESHDMRLTAVTETHIHADFVSGARELAERTGARLYLSDEGEAHWKYQYAAAYDHRLMRDGDSFRLGNIELEVMHTPGHTPEHVVFLLTDTAGANRPMGLFSGDFVFVGAVGRPDLLEKAAGVSGAALEGARQIFRSLQRFKQLPDYLQVWPAHGAGSTCGKGLGAIPSSTVGYEKLFNPALAFEDEAAFVAYILADQPEPPRYFATMKRVNKEGPRLLHGGPTPEQLPAGRLPDLIRRGALVIDTRPTDAFAGRHLPGVINIPLAQLANWAGWFVDDDQPVYLLAAGHDINGAVRDLTYIGIDHIVGYFEPDAIETLAESGQRLQTYRVETPERLAARILGGDVDVVDVRSQTEWEEGHIPGARHLMLGYLWREAPAVINGKPVALVCRSGNRSAIGASLLQAHGATEVINLQGGMRDWALAGLPIVRPRPAGPL